MSAHIEAASDLMLVYVSKGGQAAPLATFPGIGPCQHPIFGIPAEGLICKIQRSGHRAWCR